jgi:UTP--glucose-1-phosphate uridylyltransferase
MNRKTVDPKDPASTEVMQLETAMGSAISLFNNAEALRVPRTRFAPVKTTDDLLGVWSDAYTLTAEHQIIPNPARGGRDLEVSLDKRHYKFIDQLFEHFPEGAPSLVRCNSLRIRGNFFFGKDVQVIGNAILNAGEGEKHYISDGSILQT